MKMIAGATLLGLLEQVAHAAGADADDHLDELRGATARRTARRPRRRPRARAASCRCPAARSAARPSGSCRRARVYFRVRAGSRRSRRARPRPRRCRRRRRTWCAAPGCSYRLARERPRPPRPPRPPAAARGAAHQQHEQPDEQQRRAEADEQHLPHRAALVERLGVDRHALVEERREQRVIAQRKFWADGLKPLHVRRLVGRRLVARNWTLRRLPWIVSLSWDSKSRWTFPFLDLITDERVGDLRTLCARRERQPTDQVVDLKQGEHDDPE